MPTFTEFKESKPMKDQQVADIQRYSEMLCEALLLDINKNHRDSGYKFYIESGRKYHKLIMETEARSRSVHAFIDKKTGEVYKSASWKAPAKIVRYNLLDDNSREECLSRADWAGGYLYLK